MPPFWRRISGWMQTWKTADSSVDEIADYLGVAKDNIYTWVTNKGMQGHKVGRFWKFKKDDVDAWVRASRYTQVPLMRPLA